MNLYEYLMTSPPPRYKQNEFAKMAGVATATITNILKGGDYRLSIAHKIVKAGKGKITLEALAKAIEDK